MKAAASARKHYEPGFKFDGEARQSPYLQRMYPTFEALWSEGEFTRWCDVLYAPLRASVGKPDTSA
jgi:exodeoxyribonuclease V gamma subunit